MIIKKMLERKRMENKSDSKSGLENSIKNIVMTIDPCRVMEYS